MFKLTSSVAFAASLFAMAAVPCLAQDALLRSFGGGDGRTSVGVLDAGEDTGEPEGPQAIYAGDNGELYLLDQVNARILKFDSRDPAAPPQTLELPEGVSPTDLVVANGDIHIWDGRVLTLQATGRPDAPTRGLSITRSSEPPDEFTTSAFAAMGSTEVTDDIENALQSTRAVNPTERTKQYVASRQGPVVASFAPLGGESGVNISIMPKGGGNPLGKLALQVRSRLGAAELLDIDKQGRFFVFGENVPSDGTDAASAFVARFAANGGIEGVYELPLSQTSGLARRFVTVTPDGDVFFLRNKKGAADVLGVSFRRLKKGQVIGFGEMPTSLSELARMKGTNAAVRPLTRQQVLQTGAAFANVKWRVTGSAYGPDPDRQCTGFNRIRRPGFMSGKVNQEVTGIPYCWGCMGSLPQIAAMIERGSKAGNVCTRDDPRRDVVGVDCSGFVSACWGLSTHFATVAIPTITTELTNPWDLQPGDALNKPGSHVMLFVRFTPDKKAEVLEASTGGCNGKVCRNVYPLGSLLARGYHPVRYRALLNEAPVAANQAAPQPTRR